MDTTEWEATYNEALASTNFASDRREVLRGRSVEMSLKVVDESLDFVFIDVAHDEQSIRQDIKSWLPKVKQGGFISGHDYGHDYDRYGVTKVVDELVEAIGPLARFETGKWSTWFLWV